MQVHSIHVHGDVVFSRTNDYTLGGDGNTFDISALEKLGVIEKSLMVAIELVNIVQRKKRPRLEALSRRKQPVFVRFHHETLSYSKPVK